MMVMMTLMMRRKRIGAWVYRVYLPYLRDAVCGGRKRDLFFLGENKREGVREFVLEYSLGGGAERVLCSVLLWLRVFPDVHRRFISVL